MVEQTPSLVVVVVVVVVVSGWLWARQLLPCLLMRSLAVQCTLACVCVCVCCARFVRGMPQSRAPRLLTIVGVGEWDVVNVKI